MEPESKIYSAHLRRLTQWPLLNILKQRKSFATVISSFSVTLSALQLPTEPNASDQGASAIFGILHHTALIAWCFSQAHVLSISLIMLNAGVLQG